MKHSEQAGHSRWTRLRRRHVVATIGSAALPAVLAACGGTSGAAEKTMASADLTQAATLDYLTRQPYEDAFDQAIALFRTKFPNAQVARSQQPNNGVFNEKLESLVAAGTPPDVAFAVGSTYHGQATRGFYDDLTPYFTKNKEFDLNDFVPFWLEAGKWRGKQYFFPFDPGTMVLFWNKRLFTAAGVPAPDPKQPIVWTDFVDRAKRLTKAPPAVPEAQLQFGASVDTSRAWYLLPWQMGAEAFDKDVTKCLLNDPKAIDAIQFAADLQGKLGVQRPPGFQGPETAFNKGNVAMQQSGYWESGPSRTQLKPAGDDYDVAPLPTFSGRPRLTIGWGSGNALMAGSKHKALAWEFVKHLSDSTVYDILLDKGVMQPVRKSQVNSPTFRRNSPPYSFDVPIEDTKTARTPPFHPAMTELPGMVAQALADAFTGKSAVKPIMDQLVPQINQKLDEYNARFPAK